MKKCKGVVILLSCILILGDIYSISGKTITDHTEYSDIQILTLEEAMMRSNKIDNLRNEKTRCIKDKKWDRVEEIQQELEELGVRPMNETEVAELLDSKQMADYIGTSNTDNAGISLLAIPDMPASSSAACWSENIYHLVYNGIVYKITEYVATEDVQNGVLYGTSMETTYTTTLKDVKNKSITSSLIRGVATTGLSVASFFSVPVAIVSLGLTVYDACKSMVSGLSNTDTVSNITASYTLDVINEMVFLFVHRYNYSASDAIMAYAGNKIISDIAVCIPKAVLKSNKVVPKVLTIAGNTLEYTSDFYSNRIQKACENFYTYQNVSKAVKTSYYSMYFYVEFMGNKVRYKAPMPNKIFV